MKGRTMLMECVVGSTLHGTAVDDGLEDLDLMGICVEAPAQVIFGEYEESSGMYYTKDTWVERSKPEGVRSEAGDVDRTIYGLAKWCRLALNGNPTVLLPLYAPEDKFEVLSQTGRELRNMRSRFISKKTVRAFLGYMTTQRKRMEGSLGQKNCTRPELVEKYGYDTKYAGHVIRLGLQGIEVAVNGHLTLPMNWADRTLVVKVRTGGFKLEEVIRMAVGLEARLEAALEESTLPDYGDYAAVQEFVVRTYLEAWGA